jgi:hypothetical protein
MSKDVFMQIMTKIVVTTIFMIGAVITSLAPLTHAATHVQEQHDHKRIIEKTNQLANQGKTINSESFAVGSSGKEIQKQWGRPDSNNSSKDAYTYSKRQIDFFLSNDKVTHIVSYSKHYQNITYAEVKTILGEPMKKSNGEDGFYATYECGTKLLMFAFYYDKSGTKPDTIKQVVVSDQYKRMTE